MGAGQRSREPEMASVSIENVTKRYGSVTAVRDLSLQIRDGEFMVVVGPSGCGKTTTLRLIAGLDLVTSGQIRIGDAIVTRVPPARRNVAMVFESAAGLFPHLDVYHNMAFPLEVRHVPRADIESSVDTSGRRWGLSTLLRRRPTELSFGHRQQVALGRAMVRLPQVILLDQPLSNLDAKARAEMRTSLRRLHREVGTTMICTTHDQSEALALGDRIAVMHDGELAQVGTPRGVYDYPADLFVAGFIGSPHMNLVPAAIDGFVAHAAAFSVELPRAVGVERAVLGIRPEDLSEAPAGAHTIEVRADLIENLGPHQLVHGSAGPERMVARVSRSLVVFRGDVVRLQVDPNRLHLFDEATGRKLF